MLMGLIELCLLSLVTAQEPNSTAPPVAGHAVAAPAPAPAPAPGQEPGSTKEPAAASKSAIAADNAGAQDPREALQAIEAAGAEADGKILLELAMASDAQVAARAAWLLGKSSNPEHKAELPAIAANSPHAEARLQALQAIRVAATNASTPIAITALDDDDRRVRTITVQLLGKLRRANAIAPLLDLISSSAKIASDEPATDVQAALLTLSDLDASQHLLRMSTAIGDGHAAGTGAALTYAFQTLSPKLESEAETTVLVAVLDHRESLLRRYAITRLTELDSKTALTALEGRLGKEGNELRPLIEVAIAQIRHDGREPPKDEVERATANAHALWARTVSWWRTLDMPQQALVGSSPVVFLLLLWMVRRAARRRSHDEDALAAAALVQPSDDYIDPQDGDYYDDEYEDDDEQSEDGDEQSEDGDYEDDGEYAEGEYDEGDEQSEYDTSGWEDDGGETVPSDRTPEDELFR